MYTTLHTALKQLFLCTALPLTVAAQTTYRGTVRDKRTQEAIAFASVGLVLENTGTNADAQGAFTLASDRALPADTLVVSCVGFRTLKLPVSGRLNQPMALELEEQPVRLPEVMVRSRTTQLVLDDFSNCGHSYTPSSGFAVQLAQRFYAPAQNAVLTKIKICRNSNGPVDPQKTVYRLRIYGMDPVTGAPAGDLCGAVVEVRSSSRVDEVDVAPYGIVLPGKDFFIAVEWLKLPVNEKKGTVTVGGKKVKTLSYKPAIAWSGRPAAAGELWALSYREVWQPTRLGHRKLAIAATVQY